MTYKTDVQRRLAEVLDELKMNVSYYQDQEIFVIKKNSSLATDFIIYEDRPGFKVENLYLNHTSCLLKICEDGSLLYHDGAEVRVKYCNDCKKFYFGKRIRREDDKCPVCNGKSIKYLSNSSRLPGWFGEETATLIDKNEADMRLDACDSEKEDEIRKCIKKLQGKISYITMDEQKREKIIELGKRYPNMQEVVDYILTSLESSSLRKHKEISLRPFMLVGGPGCGKTSFVTELGLILLGENALKIDLGNDLPAFTIVGGDPQFRQSKQGLIIESMFKNDKHGPLKNPLIHFDELDKIHPDENYSIETVFYSILEKNTARRFYDNFIALNVDASGINYVFTANTLENIPKPIINRLKIFQIPDYTHEQLKEIVIDNFYKNWLKNNDMEQEFLPEVLSEEIKDQILNECHDDPRSIDDAITMIFTRTLTIDRESGHKIALFSPKEYYLGWKHFRGKRRISKKSWRLPENFIKPPVLDLFAGN